MTYFAAQFLHPDTAQLPELGVSVLLSVGTAAAVRFGLWCYERRLPPAVVPAPPGGTGLARITTRQAVQATAGSGFALLVGQLVSGERWYWAVGATWWVFVNTTSRGETLVRGFRRVLGTVVGAGLALLVAVPAHGDGPVTALVVAVSVFGIFYTAAVSYTWMMLWVTVLAAMLYGLLGVLTPALLGLRMVETGVGALGAALAVVFVLPVSTHSVTDAWIQRALRCVHACTAQTAARLAGTPDADPAPTVTELEQLLARVRLSVAPLVHPLNPMLGRKRRARRVLALLDDCAREIRGLVAVAADPEASHDARLAAACWRVEAAVEALTGGRDIVVRTAPPATEPALAHLHSLERALAELSTPSAPHRAPPRRCLTRPARRPMSMSLSPTDAGARLRGPAEPAARAARRWTPAPGVPPGVARRPRLGSHTWGAPDAAPRRSRRARQRAQSSLARVHRSRATCPSQ